MTTNLHAVAASVLCAILTTACLPRPGHVELAAGGHDAEPAIFRAAVSYLPALTRGLELRVDPRPLAPRPDLMSARAEDMMGPGEAERAAMLRQLGVPRVDMFDRDVCSGLGGTPPPSTPQRTGQCACR
jgi:hypothetical protein